MMRRDNGFIRSKIATPVYLSTQGGTMGPSNQLRRLEQKVEEVQPVSFFGVDGAGVVPKKRRWNRFKRLLRF